ncbi:hypothetical protein ALQ26_03979 [Pseudomonas amygdali pv. lachrymans]|nr:hypothetical protein ALQ26_03979 [Pseudomonas amygdali pv. lachrymans]
MIRTGDLQPQAALFLWAQTACTADRLLKFRKTVVLSN